MSDTIKRHKQRVRDAKQELRDLSDEDLNSRLVQIEAVRRTAVRRLQRLREAEKAEGLTPEERETLAEEARLAYDEMHRLMIRKDVAEAEIERRALGVESEAGRTEQRALLRGIAEEHTEELRVVVETMEKRPKNAVPKSRTELLRAAFPGENARTVYQRFKNRWDRRGLDWPETTRALHNACRKALRLREHWQSLLTQQESQQSNGAEA